MKKELRKKAIEERSKISEEYRYIKSLLIIEKILTLIDSLGKKNIAVYLSMKEEVDLDNLIKLLIRNHYKVMAPRMNKDVLDFYYINDLDNLEIDNKYKIREPIINKDNKISINCADIVLCPGLLFDYERNRLGYGKGYYDKALKDYKGIKIGVCFDIQLINNLEIDDNDVRMDYVITETKVLN